MFISPTFAQMHVNVSYKSSQKFTERNPNL